METENKQNEELNNGESENKKTVRQVISENKKEVIAVLIFLVLLAGSFVYSYQKKKLEKNEQSIRDNTEKFIKENLVQAGTDLKINDFQKEGGLYKMTVSVGTQEIVAYVTKDGKKFFPQVIDMDKKNETPDSSAKTKAAAEASQKKDIPEVELFVMSYCPYGVQAEKGILPVVKKLGSKIDFKIKFVGYTMHGKKEVDENVNQYCIQKEEPAKFISYLECFDKENDGAKCIASAKINKAKISACVAATDKEFKITETANGGGQTPKFNINKKENDAYGVQGSPTLVVNGTVIDSERDSDSFMKAICSGFTNKPEECNGSISSVAPAPGFGDGKSAGAAPAASCGQ
ncbi:MAG TPA: thioredoxin domain-containing protein [Candidatus Moranbacteria bacterium]|nr:thioredoxin domain-containing protein [Candidatus Moranbacteria bacterium]